MKFKINEKLLNNKNLTKIVGVIKWRVIKFGEGQI